MICANLLPLADNRRLTMLIFLKRFFLIDDTPHKIAAGAALGIFLGIAPGVGVTATIVLASICRFNRLAAITTALATNTWTLIVALPLSANVGGFLFGGSKSYLVEQFEKYYQRGFSSFLRKEVLFDIALPLTTGFVVVSGIFALVCYVIILLLIKVKNFFSLHNHHH